MFWLSCFAESDSFSRIWSHGEREREGGGGGSEIEQNLPLAWTSLSVACLSICIQRWVTPDSNVSWSASQRRVTQRTVAHRPAVSIRLSRSFGFPTCLFFSQSAERAARAAPNGVKKVETFLLVFRCLNNTASPRKAFNGVQKVQVHSKKHKPSKIFLLTIDSGVTTREP